MSTKTATSALKRQMQPGLFWRSAVSGGAFCEDELLDELPGQVSCPRCGLEFGTDIAMERRIPFDPRPRINISKIGGRFLVLPCDICFGREQRAVEAEHQERQRRAQREKWKAAWGLSGEELTMPLDALNGRLKALGEEYNSAYLVGRTGTGKTVMAALALRWLARERGMWRAQLVSEQEAVTALTDRKAGAQAKAHARLVELPVMIFDEFGRHARYDWQAGPVCSMLFERERRGRITLFTSEKSLADIAQIDGYGPSLKRRILRGCGDKAAFWAGTGTYLELDWDWGQSCRVDLPEGCLGNGRAG